jgi:hypothetical protein
MQGSYFVFLGTVKATSVCAVFDLFALCSSVCPKMHELAGPVIMHWLNHWERAPMYRTTVDNVTCSTTVLQQIVQQSLSVLQAATALTFITWPPGVPH